jgi:putative nucleotidyltransferase with HDIG domain
VTTSDRPLIELPPIIADIRAALPSALPIWLVGGALRDAWLRRSIHDLDFAVDGDGIAAARRVADALGAAVYPLDAERGIGRVILDRAGEYLTLDFSRLRGRTLATDLALRDFTVNAMAATLAAPTQLIDPLNGQADLRARVVRACTGTSIADDPVRGIRAVRLSTELKFRLDGATREQVRSAAPALAVVSAERRRDEFIRCLGGPRPAGSLRVLHALGLLPHLIPELAALAGVTQSPPHVYDVWEHTLAVVARLWDVLSVLRPVHDVDTASDLTLGLVSVRLGRHRQALDEHLNTALAGDRPDRWLLMLAALLHDIGKPTTRTVDPDGRIRFFNHDQVGAATVTERLIKLRFSNDEVRRASSIVAHHLRPLLLAHEPALSRRAIYRFFRDAGAAGVDIVLLSLADLLGTYADGPPPIDEWNRLLDVCAALLTAYFEQPTEAVNPPAIITGDDLIGELGLRPGPRIGQLLDAVREAQAGGEVTNRDGALALARQLLGRAATKNGPLS